MTTIRIEYPNQTHNGLYRAVALDMDEGFPQVLELSEGNTFTGAVGLILEIFPDAKLDDDAIEQVMVEMQMGLAA